jgi:O-antigen ligase
VLQVDVTEYLNVPGLEQKRKALGFEARGDGIRVASTTIHYIELATVMATILPFAIHLTLYAKSRKSKVRFAIAAFLCAAAVPATISRTGMLAMGIVLMVLVPVWTWRRRYNMLATITAFIGAFVVVQPGLMLTMTHLFDDPSNNPAFTVRQERYPLVWHYVGQRPWFGRGTGTYVSPQYQLLDNEWLEYLVSNGIVGVATLALLHLTGIVLALMAFRRAESKEIRHLCAAAISTQLVALVVAGTFDSLSFLTYAITTALTLGICGTLWRLTHPKRMVRTSTTRWFAADPGQ